MGSTAYQINPVVNSKTVQFSQRVIGQIKPNHRYRFGLVYKCVNPASTITPGQSSWSLGVYTGGNGLYKWLISGENKTELSFAFQNQAINQQYLPYSNSFQTVYRDFVFSSEDALIAPPYVDVRLFNGSGSTTVKDNIIISGIFLREIKNESLLDSKMDSMQRVIYSQGKPTRGTVFIGDIIKYVTSNVATNGFQSWVISEGTFGTLIGVTGSISANGSGNASSYIITISGGMLSVGDIVMVGNDTTHYYITQALSSTQYITHTYAKSTQTNAPVTYVKPSLYNITNYKNRSYAETITTGVTSWTHTNSSSSNQQIVVSGGNVSQISFTRQGVTQNLGLTNGIFILVPEDSLNLTLTDAYRSSSGPLLYVIPM